MKDIESLLREQIGLDAASIGSSLIERTVRLRMKARGVRDLEEYKEMLESSRAAWDELVEAVVVTETWFFRDREPFRAFVRLVQEEWQPSPRAALSLRVLSVPCSSGEEPYSLAMALLDAGLPRERFTIEAVDISLRALERAQRAVYGKNSFRGKELDFRDIHFQRTDEGYLLSPAVRDCVKFEQGNLLGEDFLPGRNVYDFIFCRNLLIYFDQATQTRALEKLHRMLAPDGLLFVGPAELPLVMDRGFATANIPMAFACRKAVPAPSPRSARLPRRARAPVLPELPPLPASTAAASLSSDNRTPSPHPAHQAAIELVTDLNAARALADEGKFKEAVAICEAHLSEHGPTAQAYYLLGLIHDANADPLAVEFYRKALYLEPNHYETLLQLALLAQKNGETAKARAFKRRAQRAQEKIAAET